MEDELELRNLLYTIKKDTKRTSMGTEDSILTLMRSKLDDAASRAFLQANLSAKQAGYVEGIDTVMKIMDTLIAIYIKWNQARVWQLLQELINVLF